MPSWSVIRAETEVETRSHWVIATRADEDCADGIRNQIVSSNLLFLATQASQQCNGEPWFEFVTLWPFNEDYCSWPD